MGVNGLGGLERHGAHGTFIEQLAVGVLDVGLEGRRIAKDHAAVDAPGNRKRIGEGTFVKRKCSVSIRGLACCRIGSTGQRLQSFKRL